VVTVLDVRKLLLLREVDARGSIAAAAEALNYTRSAVSQQLSALEAETGVPLLDRSNRKAELTEAGRLLIRHGERILSQLEEAESDLLAAAGRVHGSLRVGVPFHEGPALLVSALTGMRERYPELRITLHGIPAAESRQAVRTGRLDLVLAARYDQVPEVSVPGLYEEQVVSDRIRLAVRPGHPLAGAGARPLSAFAADPWIVNPASALGRLTLHTCAAAGFQPEITADSDDMQATLGLVSLGWGVALVPDLAPDRPGYPVARVAVEGARLTRHVSLVVRRGTLSCPSIEAVLTAVREGATVLARTTTATTTTTTTTATTPDQDGGGNAD
jgi:DNA-binding transcriptional LysR family regulator